RRLAASTWPAEQVGVADPPGPQRLHQGLGDVLLADDIGEGLGPVAAIQGCAHAPNVVGSPDTLATRRGMRGPPAYLEELACPCCLPALGEFGEVPPHGGPGHTLDETLPERLGKWLGHRGNRWRRPVVASGRPSGSLLDGGFA